MRTDNYSWLKTDERLLWDSRRIDARRNLLIPFIPSLYKQFFFSADLVISNNEIIEPYIQLSKDAVLKYPHVEYNGKVCLQTEPYINITAKEFINQLIDCFCGNFLKEIILGTIQDDFYVEPEHYWAIYVNKFDNLNRRKKIRVNKLKNKIFGLIDYPSELILLDKRTSHFVEYNSTLIEKKQIIAGTDSNYKTSILKNYRNTQKKLMTLEIPINMSYQPKKWPKNKKELFNTVSIFTSDNLAKKYIQANRLIILRAPNCNYAYFIHETNKLIPLECDKADIEWIYGRYKNNKVITNQGKKIVCFGAGSLGSQIIPLLVREGVNEITIVDHDKFDTPNLSRHLLGMNSLYKYKVSELKVYINRYLPTCNIIDERITAQRWLQKNKSLLNKFDLLIDLTGSENVRNILDEVRKEYSIPLIAGWMEPFVTAAHVVYFPNDKYWSCCETDLWEEIAAFQEWPDNYLQNEPGCSSRFQSYSGIETFKAVSIIAEACIDSLNYNQSSSHSQIEVTSLVRGEDFCLKQEYKAKERASWAQVPEELDCIIIKRLF
ncbi:ThiF family adenylyltransferase [Entomomonas asaccharolytica]|uniref:ThiF family adenylyltransferase n=1 Tax=Entomomonas asaccharolytica TaxID=2785331 RepID=A0A974RX94_9GAMM|nr:ThiF family adenylyltransferase [Entomomonas asaccharolytica]QQP86031.1 ThiF family adenylyltransferase [Entomomonas asaccharolytica]